MTANPAALLDTMIFDDTDESTRKYYVSNIVRTIMGHNFLTDAGIRSRSLHEAGLVDFWDYHGSFTTWPKETYDIAKGLRRQGFPKLASELENRLVNVVFKNREYPEFIYVDERGRVMSKSPGAHEHGSVVLIDSTNSPEKIQAWTVSAVVAILAVKPNVSLKKLRNPKRANWQSELEKHILKHIPQVKILIANPAALTARYPNYPYEVKPSPGNQPSNLL
jgi:glycogen debranching enzyme